MRTIREYRRRVTAKGSVTIPAAIRELLGLESRGEVLFRVIEGRRVELLPAAMTLAAAFGSVTPQRRPEDLQTLRDVAIDEHVAGSLDETKD